MVREFLRSSLACRNFMEKCFLPVFALVKESKQGQDKIILLLIVILSPPPPIRFFFRISASISIKCGKTKNKNNQSEKRKISHGANENST